MKRRIPRMVSFDPIAKNAGIVLGSAERILPARKTGDLYLVYGFACVFETGEKIWKAQVEFSERAAGQFSYHDIEVPDFIAKGLGAPPNVVGFFDDISEKDRGTPQGSAPRTMWPTYRYNTRVPSAKKKRRLRPWKPEHIRRLRLYAKRKFPLRTISRLLRRTPSAVSQKARSIGIRIATKFR